MSKASIEKEMNSPSEQSEDGDQFHITMQKFIISQQDNPDRQRSQLNIPGESKQDMQVDSDGDISEEEKQEIQSKMKENVKIQETDKIIGDYQQFKPSLKNLKKKKEVMLEDKKADNIDKIALTGYQTIQLSRNPKKKYNFFNKLKQKSSSPEDCTSPLNQLEDLIRDTPQADQQITNSNEPLKGYCFGDHPQTLEALRNGSNNGGSCNDILHKNAVFREKEFLNNEFNMKMSKENLLQQQPQEASNQFQQLHKVGSYQVAPKKLFHEEVRRGQSLGQLDSFWNVSLKNITSQKVTPPKSEEDHNGIQQTGVPLSSDSEQNRGQKQNKLCLSNDDPLENDSQIKPQAAQDKEQFQQMKPNKITGRYPFRIVPLKDSEDQTYQKELRQTTTREGISKQQTNHKRRLALSKKTLKDKPLDFESLLYKDTTSQSSFSSTNFDNDDSIPWYILNPMSKFRIVWNILLVLIMLFNALIIPLRLGFYGEDQSEFYVVDLVIDSLFIVEFIQSFFSAYENQEGKMVFKLSSIILHNLKGWFAIDFISSVMVFVVDSTTTSNIMRMFRIPKIYKQVSETRLFQILDSGRIMRCILFLKTNDHYFDILRFSVIIIFLIHITGSIWYFFATMHPELNWYQAFYKSDDGSDSQKYTASVYYVLSVLTTVGYGNIVSQNKSEYTFTTLFMFFAVIIYSWILGVLTYSFYKINEKGAILKDRFIYYNQIVSNFQLSRNLQEKLLKTVQIGFNSASNRLLDIYQTNDILQELSDETLGMVCENIFGTIIKKIPFFSTKSPIFIAKLLQKVKSIHMNSGDILYDKGAVSKYVYFLVKGRVVTKIQSVFENFKTLVYVEGSFFGEVDMILKRERRQSAYAETKCEVWRIDKEEFQELMEQYEDIKSEIIQQAIKKEELAMKEEMKLLRAKLKEDPALNTLIFDEMLKQPQLAQDHHKQHPPKQENQEEDQQSIGQFIEEEIVIQSKKRAYGSSFTKEMSMTDIIKMSSHRLLAQNDTDSDERAIDHIGDPLNCSQSLLKQKAIHQMISLIQQHETVNLNEVSVQRFLGTKKFLGSIQNFAVINIKQPAQVFQDKELEDVLQAAAVQIRNMK